MPTWTHRLISWLDLGLASSLWPCLVITGPDPNTDLQTDFPVWSRTCLITMIPLYDLRSWLGWPPSQGLSCSPHSGAVGWTLAGGGSVLPTLGSPAAPSPGGAALLLLLPDVHSASGDPLCCVPREPALCREDKVTADQLCLFSFHTGRSHHICLVKHTLSRGKNVHMWHMNVSQLQPECSFLREICRKRQKGLLVFKAWIKSPSQAGGCKRHQGPCKFGRVHIHMHTHNFNLTSCQHIPSTEGRRILHLLTELGRLQY